MHFHVSEQQCDVMVNSLTQAPDYCDVNSSAATCGYMTSGKVLILSVPRFPHLEMGIIVVPNFVGFFGGSLIK